MENHKNLSDFLRQLLYMTIKMFKKAKKVSHSNPFDCYGFKNGNLDKQKSRAARETQIKSSVETSLLLFLFLLRFNGFFRGVLFFPAREK